MSSHALKTTDHGPIPLLGLDREALGVVFAELGEKPFRVHQALKWLHARQNLDIASWTDFSQALRDKLLARADITLPEIQLEHVSEDGTVKWLFDVPGGSAIETVFIPQGTRGTLCISSQIGCILDCKFCATGKQGFSRNLSATEIIAQLWIAKRRLSEMTLKTTDTITNVVFMGMGEPLLNFDAVKQAARLMMDDCAYGLSKRKVTISTSGVVPGIDQLIEEVDCALALSLHAPNDALREAIIPLNKKYPLDEVLAACQRYVEKGSRQKHVTIEYVMLRDVNDQDTHARELITLLSDLPVKINLIPFNGFTGADFRCSAGKRIEAFSQILMNAGLTVTVRRTRGDDIAAACGQLAGKVKDRTRRQARFLAKTAASAGSSIPIVVQS